MPMKNKAGGCNCCGGGPTPCTVCSPTQEAFQSYDSTFTMEGSTHYRWDLPAASGVTWLSSYDAKYVVYEISNGDWYRINLPFAPTFGASSLCLLEKSTDSGVTWTTETSIYTHNIGSEVSYFDDCRCGNESPTLTDDIVSTKPITNRLNLSFYGSRGSNAILGLTNQRKNYSPSTLEDWLTDDGDGTGWWDSTSGKGVFTCLTSIEIAGATISDVYLADTSSASKGWLYVHVGTYTGYNCASEADPNCGCICPGSFPGASLNLTEASISVSGSLAGTITMDGDFAASPGFCDLDSLSSTAGLSEFSSGAALTTISNYVSNSEPEWSGVGVERQYIGNDNGYRDPSSGLATGTKVCVGNAFSRPLVERNLLDGWFAEYQRTTPTGFDTYGPQGGGGGTQLGSASGAVLKYSWAANGGATDLTSLTASIDSTYNGAYIRSSEVKDQNGSAELSVVSEDDCSVTFELEATYGWLVHGLNSAVSGNLPKWDCAPTVSNVGSKTEYDFDYTGYFEVPAVPGNFGGRFLTEIVPNDPFTPVFDTQTNVYAFEIDNGVGSAVVQAESFRNSNLATNSYYIQESVAAADPGWAPWVVTFRKTVLKTALASATVTVSFSGSDVFSSNYNPSTMVTWRPIENSGGFAIAGQYNSLGVITPGGGSFHNILVVTKPGNYSSPTISVSESDFSASVTLNQGPFYA